MEYRPKSTFEIRSKRTNYYNIYNDKNINQSPKRSSNKIRVLQEGKKLFSLIDINEKITNSKGTSLPKQFKRLSQKEINKHFGMDKSVGWSYNKLLINKFMKRIQTTKVLINTKDIMTKNDLPKIENKIDNKKTPIERISTPRTPINNERKIMMPNIENQNNNNLNSNIIEFKENNSLNDNNINNIEKKETKINNNENLKTPENLKKLYINISKKRNDRWMPKNYQNYELLVKNPNLIYHKLKDDSMKRKIPIFSCKEIKKKMNETDVFFIKNQRNPNNFFPQKQYTSSVYNDSDIFCMKNDVSNLSKCGETYLFKSNSNKKYTSVNESNSRWQPCSNIPNLINYTSIEFNILCPNKKYFNKTKKEILEECENRIKNNKSYKENKNICFNPSYKQKGLAEFIDITQNGSGNPGKEFVKCFKDNPFCFQKNSDVCATYGDIHVDYKSTCTRPFMKDRF